VPAVAPPEPPLTDGVVALRGWRAADVPALTAACQDPEIPRWTLVPRPYTEAIARTWIATTAEQYAAGTGAPLAVVDAAGGRLLASAGLNVIDWAQRTADVGYWVAAPERGRGVASRAVALVADWAFGTLGLELLGLLTDPGNRASQAVARRTGFVPAAAPVVPRPECGAHGHLAFARRRA
jgi:RimJ/RimL family protein N-acetyltransferase